MAEKTPARRKPALNLEEMETLRLQRILAYLAATEPEIAENRLIFRMDKEAAKNFIHTLQITEEALDVRKVTESSSDYSADDGRKSDISFVEYDEQYGGPELTINTRIIAPDYVHRFMKRKDISDVFTAMAKSNITPSEKPELKKKLSTAFRQVALLDWPKIDNDTILYNPRTASRLLRDHRKEITAAVKDLVTLIQETADTKLLNLKQKVQLVNDGISEAFLDIDDPTKAARISTSPVTVKQSMFKKLSPEIG